MYTVFNYSYDSSKDSKVEVLVQRDETIAEVCTVASKFSGSGGYTHVAECYLLEDPNYYGAIIMC